MKRKYLKKCLCTCLICAMAVGTTGCKQLDMSAVTDLTEAQEQLLVDYAANAVLNYDKNYIDRMQTVKLKVEEPETEEATQAPEQSTSDDGTVSSGVAVEDPVTTMNAILKMNGVDIQPTGFEVVDSYPSNGQELGMSMVAIKGCKLLVIKFHVTGNGTELDMLGTGAVYKGIINDSVKVNAQVTALLDAFNTYQGTIPQGEAEDLVLVFQVDENDVSNIQSVKLNVSYDGQQGNVLISGQ